MPINKAPPISSRADKPLLSRRGGSDGREKTTELKTIFAAINKSYQSSADGEVLQACTPELRTAAINKGAACPIPGKGRGGRFVEHNNGNQIVLQ